MHDELTKKDIEKMEAEIEHRKQLLILLRLPSARIHLLPVGLIHTRANLSILFADILITLTRLSTLRFMTRTAPSLITIRFVSMLLKMTSGMPLFFRTELISPINRRFLLQ